MRDLREDVASEHQMSDAAEAAQKLVKDDMLKIPTFGEYYRDILDIPDKKD